MSEIYFCDLCNESVPQLDLDRGHATRQKGRVVCATCHRAMGPALPESTSATPTPAAHAPLPAPGSIHSHGHAHAATHSAPSGAVAALTLACVALAVAVTVGVWARGALDEVGVQRREEQLRERERHQALAAHMEAAAASDSALRASSEARTFEALSGLRAEVASLRGEMAEQQGGIRARLEELGAGAARAEVALQRVERHEGELLTLQQHVVDAQAALAALSQRLEQALSNAPTGLGAAQPQAAEDPAWIALMEQVRSANVSERYVALVGLAQSRDPRATSVVLPLLDDADIFLRMAAARALGDLASAEAIPGLIDTLDDDEALVREAAYLSLRSVTGRDLPFDAQSPDAAERARRIKAWREWWDKERPKLGL
ncbi:MAG: HEAT repeat domain-containing protein [Planctomycetes bacterium]|nr:HEAT repeat domain-containing protein [Planctomycetota bacterium]